MHIGVITKLIHRTINRPFSKRNVDASDKTNKLIMHLFGHIQYSNHIVALILLSNLIINNRFNMAVMLSSTRQFSAANNSTSNILKIEFHPSERSLTHPTTTTTTGSIPTHQKSNLINEQAASTSSLKKARSATAHRIVPPVNGSIFGKRKRSVDSSTSSSNKHLINAPMAYQSPSSITTHYQNTQIPNQTNKLNKSVQQRDSPEDERLAQYNDIITDIIEDFMAQNKESK